MPSISGTCDVCSDAPSKYRCPTCEILYCSLNCFKGHKGKHPFHAKKRQDSCKPAEHNDSQSKSREETRNHGQNTPREEGEISSGESDVEEMEDRVQPDRLQQLGESEELKDLLHNPHLRQMLSHLDQTDNKEKAIANAMQEPLFVEFADQCLRIVEGDDERTMEST